MQQVSDYIVPVLLCIAGLIMLGSGSDMFGEFVSGAREGLGATLRLLPTLIALIVGVSMLTASGAAEALSRLLSPLLVRVGVPDEVVGLVALRPFSGGGSLAMLSQLFESLGADSLAGRAASVIAGSGDTVFYVIGVYFSSVGVKKSRAALPCALATMLFCVIFGSFLAKMLS